MRVETLGELRCRITGGTDREGGGDGPVVVLLHGFGAPGDDLVGLWRTLDVPAGTRFVFPEAPLSLTMGLGDSRAWWMIDVDAVEKSIISGEPRDMSGQVPEGLQEARDKILGMLEALDAELKPQKGQLVLGGFSQGSMLALDVALHTDRALAGLVLLSCTLLSEEQWVARLPDRKGLPVLQSHGENDELLPFSMATRLRDRLKEAELEVHFVSFRGGHQIPGAVVDGIEGFLQQTLSDWA